MEQSNQQQEVDDQTSGFQPVYRIELLFHERPVISESSLQEAMTRYSGGVPLPAHMLEAFRKAFKERQPEGLGEELPLIYVHTRYTAKMKDADIPVQTLITGPVEVKEPERWEKSLQQAWHWPEARSTVSKVKYSVTLQDMFGAGLPYSERLELMQSALRALLDVLPCEAVYWYTSDKLVQPQAYLEALKQEDILYGAMNVRMYQVDRGAGENDIIMDTLGLSAVGIPDIQCHFNGLDPDKVAESVYGAAYYVFHNGDIIENGQSIGSAGGQQWRCEHQHALAKPQRFVLDLDPGAPHNAGRGPAGGSEQ
ncbi:DUF4261 domain-containing protein [Paenibacillus sp. JX-17]|uniref:DUF4261 domain-containing protein n=1 Tax=Paenibacillus lacisoli TaxID=3064525 RepID=A0ABT9C9W2_9BACL|nr:DUF4261 domain-containing protein [Paenibacillus sp. JX-17]MDO7906047.1 DUF4261 domain-containing protein [Paenibacillus sp. JX-17]